MHAGGARIDEAGGRAAGEWGRCAAQRAAMMVRRSHRIARAQLRCKCHLNTSQTGTGSSPSHHDISIRDWKQYLHARTPIT